MIRPTAEEQSVFERAIEFEAPDERDAYLDQVCADDPSLRSRIDKLLKFHDTDEDFLETPAVRVPAAVPEDIVGSRIGRYEVLKRIGEGGFGVVYQARQEEPVRRDVAIKIIKPGMDTQQIIGRFEAERQALAMMNHPNIATVLDAGATENGRMYFVMELVDGKPIDKFCKQQALTLDQRLRLFVSVCQAIQHAHQKGIVHRDLKPSNILVQFDNERPAAKVIDFGIAKAIETPLRTDAPQTDLKQLLGTPEYMSPEQVTPRQDVDTRADVYTLGGTLYKLLTGAAPLDAELIRRAEYDQIYQLIREHEPPRPSVRLRGETDMTVRPSSNLVSPRSLQGDLDWIVMKALQKERANRYESAADFARDIERYLAFQPVFAGPPSVVYRAKKFLHRNRIWVIATLFVLAALVLGLVSVERERWKTYQQWQRAEQQRLITDQQRELVMAEVEKSLQMAAMLEETIAAAAPDQGRPAARQLLEKISASLDDKLLGYPKMEARLRRIIGRLWMRLWEPNKAGYHLQRALELRRREFGDVHPLTTQSQVDFAQYLDSVSRVDEAEQMVTVALGRLRSTGPSEELIDALDLLQKIRRIQQAIKEQHAFAREAWDVANELHGSEHPVTLVWQSRVASTARQGRRNLDEAYRLTKDALERISKLRPADHLDVALAKQCHARVLQRRREFALAERLVSESMAVHRKLVGYDSQFVVRDLIALARIQRADGRTDDALATAREAVAIAERSTVEGDRQRIHAYNLLRKITYRVAPEEAAEAARQVALARTRLLPNHPSVRRAIGLRTAAIKFRRLGRFGKADECFRYAITILLRHPIENQQDISRAFKNFIEMLCECGAEEAAEDYLVQTLATLQNDHRRNEPVIAAVSNHLLNMHCRSNGTKKAEEYLHKRIAFLREHSTSGSEIAQPLCQLGLLFRHQQRWEESVECYHEALRELREHSHDNDAIARTLQQLGDLSREAGMLDGVHEILLEALQLASSEASELPILQIDLLETLILQDRLSDAQLKADAWTASAEESDSNYLPIVARTAQAQLMMARSDFESAEKMLRKILGTRGRRGNSQLTSRIRGLHFETLMRLGRYAEAEKGLLKASNFMSKVNYSPAIYHRVRRQLVRLYESWDKPDEAAEWREMLVL